ncbi:ArsC family reductase [Arcticibacter sp. MXS-1]|uniref:ArsC family reductase n=1 Tax=Arcticibacter sp. MXS-1 TaxID=3341726 RepID=UPI0035A83403
MKVYGIKNCDTVKKALKWLDDHHITYEFHDFKKLGVSEEKLAEWDAKAGWEALINKRGTTWKKLDPAIQASVSNKQAAFQLMMEKTSVIRRPVIETQGSFILGFNEAEYLERLGQV